MMKRQQQNQQRRHQDQQSKVFYELSSLVLSLLRSPPPAPIEFSDSVAADESIRHRPMRAAEISPAGFAALMLGISMALMLCGSVTFFIGFLLMPWVIGLFFVFYVVGVVSTLLVLGRAVLFCNSPPPVKDIPAWKL